MNNNTPHTSKKIASYGSYGLHIMQCPSGKFSYVGTVPEILTVEKKNSIGLPYNSSLIFDTLEMAENHFNSVKHLID